MAMHTYIILCIHAVTASHIRARTIQIFNEVTMMNLIKVTGITVLACTAIIAALVLCVLLAKAALVLVKFLGIIL